MTWLIESISGYMEYNKRVEGMNLMLVIATIEFDI